MSTIRIGSRQRHLEETVSSAARHIHLAETLLPILYKEASAFYDRKYTPSHGQNHLTVKKWGQFEVTATTAFGNTIVIDFANNNRARAIRYKAHIHMAMYTPKYGGIHRKPFGQKKVKIRMTVSKCLRSSLQVYHNDGGNDVFCKAVAMAVKAFNMS